VRPKNRRRPSAVSEIAVADSAIASSRFTSGRRHTAGYSQVYC
jgi:hypothetical protein